MIKKVSLIIFSYLVLAIFLGIVAYSVVSFIVERFKILSLSSFLLFAALLLGIHIISYIVVQPFFLSEIKNKTAAKNISASLSILSMIVAYIIASFIGR